MSDLKYLKSLEIFLYCVESMMEDHNKRNFGDRDEWFRHVNQKLSAFEDLSEEAYSPLEWARLQIKNLSVSEDTCVNQQLKADIAGSIDECQPESRD